MKSRTRRALLTAVITSVVSLGAFAESQYDVIVPGVVKPRFPEDGLIIQDQFIGIATVQRMGKVLNFVLRNGKMIALVYPTAAAAETIKARIYGVGLREVEIQLHGFGIVQEGIETFTTEGTGPGQFEDLDLQN